MFIVVIITYDSRVHTRSYNCFKKNSASKTFSQETCSFVELNVASWSKEDIHFAGAAKYSWTAAVSTGNLAMLAYTRLSGLDALCGHSAVRVQTERIEYSIQLWNYTIINSYYDYLLINWTKAVVWHCFVAGTKFKRYRNVRFYMHSQNIITKYRVCYFWSCTPSIRYYFAYLT